MIKYPSMDNFYKFLSTPVILTEKIHGANIRIQIKTGWMYNYRTWVYFGSRNTEYGKEYPTLYNSQEIFESLPYDKLNEFVRKHFEGFVEGEITFFGELYGKGIQKGMDYRDLLGDKDRDLIFFDIHSSRYEDFLHFHSVVEIIESLGLKAVPIIEETDMRHLIHVWYPNLDEKLEEYKTRMNLDRKIEGIVARLPFDSNWKYKMKTKEFEEVSREKSTKSNQKEDINPYDYVTKARVEHAIDRFYEAKGIMPKIENTGEIIKDTVADIHKDTSDEELPKQLGTAIAKIFHEILKGGYYG